MSQATYAVIGLARAGIPAARFLASQGNRVVGYDSRTLAELSDEARALADLGVELRTGEHGFAGLDECQTIVLSPGLKIHHEPLKLVIAEAEARGSEVIGELELAWRHCPAPIIAVTGTKGKSTTVKLIEEMLRACGVEARRCGNTGVPLTEELPNLSPQNWAVVEVSSFQLERAPTFRPRIAVLLNLLADHQDYHPSLEQYWSTKLKIFANQGEGDTAIFNCDDEDAESFFATSGLEVSDGAEGWWTWQHSDAEHWGVSGQNLDARDGEDLFAFWRDDQLGLDFDAGFLPFISGAQVPLAGTHNRANLAAALAAVAAATGDELIRQKREAIAGAIRNFESLPHRLEVVGTVRGVRCVNDSQATIPEAAMRAMEAWEPPITLIAGGRAKLDNADAFDELGKAVAARAHRLAVIGEAAERIAEAAKRAGYPQDKIILGETLTNALKTAIIETPSGGTVVMSPACASFDQFASFEARGQAFRNAVAVLQDELGT